MGPNAIQPIHVGHDGTTVVRELAAVRQRKSGEAAAPVIRLQLGGARPDDDRRTLDGGWWPHSRNFIEELPALISELRRQGVRVSRVSYNPEAWDQAPKTVAVEGRPIKLGSFHSMDRHRLTVTGIYGVDRTDLLVVPPESLAAAAGRLMAASSEPHNTESATALLRADADGSRQEAALAAASVVAPADPGAAEP